MIVSETRHSEVDGTALTFAIEVLPEINKVYQHDVVLRFASCTILFLIVTLFRAHGN